MDARSDLEKAMWEKLGPPLYYCEECLLAVQVTPRVGQEPLIERKCSHVDAPIIAPRKSILAGKGGLNLQNRAKLSWWQLLAALTGRCV